MKVLVTGAAGFIGFHTTKRLLKEGIEVVGVDNINDYYDVNLKYSRLKILGISKEEIEYGKLIGKEFRFIKLDLADKEGIDKLFKKEKFDRVIHLGAQAGVRYSIQNPYAYINSNIMGHLNMLEAVRNYGSDHFVYASTSSVYGLNKKQPFSVEDNVDHPVSLYAATKKSDELMSHTYSYLYDIPTTGLRFFTVYGPWGRPDMALFKFVKNIIEDKPIDVYNYGNMKRDFTYIDDIVEGVVRVMKKAPSKGEWRGEVSKSIAPYRIYNIGNGSPVGLMEFIEAIEEVVGKKAKKNFLPMQPGDVEATWADTSELERDFGYKPFTPVKEGIEKFVKWYREFYRC
jgi:UDP-glucuronate 4-epimerase